MPVSTIAKYAKKRPPYFWWLLAHALALCFCTVTWIMTIYVFQNPELPRNYAMLKKIGQAPAPLPLTVLTAPEGDAIRPEQIYKEFVAYALPENEDKLRKRNSRLLRGYLETYKSTKPRYIEGNYRILQIRPLTEKDMVYPGFVIRAQAMVQPDQDRPAGPYPVFIESVFPCANQAAFTWFKPGDILRMQKIPDCVAIIHVSHLGTADEPMINLTVAPIAYNDLKIGISRIVSIAPPEKINLYGKLPMFEPNAKLSAP